MGSSQSTPEGSSEIILESDDSGETRILKRQLSSEEISELEDRLKDLTGGQPTLDGELIRTIADDLGVMFGEEEEEYEEEYEDEYEDEMEIVDLVQPIELPDSPIFPNVSDQMCKGVGTLELAPMPVIMPDLPPVVRLDLPEGESSIPVEEEEEVPGLETELGSLENSANLLEPVPQLESQSPEVIIKTIPEVTSSTSEQFDHNLQQNQELADATGEIEKDVIIFHSEETQSASVEEAPGDPIEDQLSEQIMPVQEEDVSVDIQEEVLQYVPESTAISEEVSAPVQISKVEVVEEVTTEDMPLGDESEVLATQQLPLEPCPEVVLELLETSEDQESTEMVEKDVPSEGPLSSTAVEINQPAESDNDAKPGPDAEMESEPSETTSVDPKIDEPLISEPEVAFESGPVSEPEGPAEPMILPDTVIVPEPVDVPELLMVTEPEVPLVSPEEVTLAESLVAESETVVPVVPEPVTEVTEVTEPVTEVTEVTEAAPSIEPGLAIEHEIAIESETTGFAESVQESESADVVEPELTPEVSPEPELAVPAALSEPELVIPETTTEPELAILETVPEPESVIPETAPEPELAIPETAPEPELAVSETAPEPTLVEEEPVPQETKETMPVVEELVEVIPEPEPVVLEPVISEPEPVEPVPEPVESVLEPVEAVLELVEPVPEPVEAVIPESVEAVAEPVEAVPEPEVTPPVEAIPEVESVLAEVPEEPVAAAEVPSDEPAVEAKELQSTEEVSEPSETKEESAIGGLAGFIQRALEPILGGGAPKEPEPESVPESVPETEPVPKPEPVIEPVPVIEPEVVEVISGPAAETLPEPAAPEPVISEPEQVAPVPVEPAAPEPEPAPPAVPETGREERLAESLFGQFKKQEVEKVIMDAKLEGAKSQAKIDAEVMSSSLNAERMRWRNKFSLIEGNLQKRKQELVSAHEEGTRAVSAKLMIPERREACGSEVSEIIQCYQSHPTEVLRCQDLARSFDSCVTESLASR